MSYGFQAFLIKSQQKVVDHYRRVLRDRFISCEERERLKRRLDRAEADLRALGSSRAASGEASSFKANNAFASGVLSRSHDDDPSRLLRL